MNWYKVEIHGRYDGRPREVRRTVQARDAYDAIFSAISEEFADEGDSYSRMVEGCVVFQWEFSRAQAFITEHESMDEMVDEAVDAAALARLTGHPTLPLVME